MDRDSPSALPFFPQFAGTLESRTALESPPPAPASTPAKKSKSKGKGNGKASPAAGSSAVLKTFVLDTNVLLHDPACLNRFGDNHVCIPVDVLSEMDRFKGEPTERGANAREVHRTLTKFFSAHSDQITAGVPTAGGGTVRLVIYDPQADESPALQRFQHVFPGLEKMDHRIMACTLWLQENNKGGPVILITKDLNMQLKARAVGIKCEDYLNDKVEVREVSNFDLGRIEISAHELQRFASSGRLDLPAARLTHLAVNEYVLLAAGEKQTMPARLHPQGGLVKLIVPENIRIGTGRAIKSMNLGQACYLDALLNPDISLVTCYGQAGTGKTLLAVAAGLSQVFDHTYNGLTISRPIVAMGQTVGFLPGSLQDKMRPWLQPVYDALELLMRPMANTQGPQRKKNRFQGAEPGPGAANAQPTTPYDGLIQNGVLEIEALCYIRGRSIPERFFVLDEAQQLTPLEAKTVVTRMSRGSKLVLIGDPAQIDNPYVDSRSNGLVYTRQRMRGQPFAAHIPLLKGERSPLAEAGARLL
ncbi:MAG: PhoH family protein [Verrucomicrobiaceae bacterium]|nr:PhoH family protein [Verrucomicrobiaceae bacterium]